MSNRRFKRRAVIAAFVLSMALPPPVLAFEGPKPPCDETSKTIYPETGEAPLVRVWTSSELPPDWTPPSCTGWSSNKTQLYVSLAGRFHGEQSADALLDSFGAVSHLIHVRYWSRTDNAWQSLFESATALEGPELTHHRQDFSFKEMTSGRDLYFAQKDNRSTNQVIYRMRAREAGVNGFIVEMENVTAVRFYLLTVFQPHALQSIFFLKQSASSEWTYYCLVRVGQGLSIFTSSRDSFINRALALYYHYAAMPNG